MEKARKKLAKKRRKKISLKRRLEEGTYHYQVSVETYSKVKYEMRKLGVDKTHPGRDALKEVLTFLQMHTPQDDKHRYWYYNLALKSARNKVQGRRFSDENRQGRQGEIISTTEDVEEVIQQALRTEGIYTPVEELVYYIISD